MGNLNVSSFCTECDNHSTSTNIYRIKKSEYGDFENKFAFFGTSSDVLQYHTSLKNYSSNKPDSYNSSHNYMNSSFVDFYDPSIVKCAIELATKQATETFEINKSLQLKEDITESKENDHIENEMDSENSFMISEKLQIETFSPSSSQAVSRLILTSPRPTKLNNLFETLQSHIIHGRVAEVQEMYQEHNIPIANLRFSDNTTPLYLAIEYHHHSMVVLLLNLGCNPEHGEYKGMTPLQLANEIGDYNIIETLLSELSEYASIVSSQINSITVNDGDNSFEIQDSEYLRRESSSSINVTFSSDTSPDIDVYDCHKIQIANSNLSVKIKSPILKKKTVNRKVRKLASRIMSVFVPSKFPKNRQRLK